MWQIIESAAGSVVGAIIISVFGISGTTVVINSVSSSYNPRKKWRILMVVSVIAFLLVGAFTTTYNGGLAYYSDSEQTMLWICGLFFVGGWIGNWVNK